MKILAHHDADGITTAYFTQFEYGESEIIFPETFGDVKKFKKGDIMVDMRPTSPDIEGIVIDHHLPHPEERKYKLIQADYPASLIAWEQFKDKIPETEWWKLEIGLGGDGALHLTPPIIFQKCPLLLKHVKTSSYYQYSKLRINTIPIYKELSSAINCFLRKSEFDTALNLMKYADNPLTLVTSEDVKLAKADIKNEFTSIVRDMETIEFGNLIVIIFQSKYRMTGYIASALSNVFNSKTILSIDTRTGSLSLRGDLALYYKDLLKKLPYLDIDGHPGFMGGKIHKNINKLISDLDAVL